MRQDADSVGVQLRSMLAEILNVKVDDVSAILAKDDGEIDSHHGVELLLAIEVTYGVSFPDDVLTPETSRSFPLLKRLISSMLDDAGVVIDDDGDSKQ